METGTDRLTETAPPPCPVREMILARFADSAQAPGSPVMDVDDLIGYLQRSDRPDLPPLEALRLQTEAVGEGSRPSPEHAAMLEWLAASFEFWRTAYPLESPLAERVRLLQPIAAALAVKDPEFLLPGQHPLHALLDSLHDYATGWMPSLGRAGKTVEKQLEAAIEAARGWFDDPGIDIAVICEAVETTAERDMQRARRMTQRMVDTEQGKLRATSARQEAAHMINDVLSRFEIPAVVGAFLKGPWFDSAQLVWLKFGADSGEWRELSDATEALADSMQVENPRDDKRRQYLFEAVTRIPKDLKRWLLSLQHDSAAADDAVEPIEACHLRILRELELDVVFVEPLEVAGEEEKIRQPASDRVAQLETGQWFRIEQPTDEPVRAQLALKLDQEQLLLFANQAGIKALQLDFDGFDRLLAEGRAVRLEQGLSFSRSLARSAGIYSDEEMTALIDASRELSRKYQERQASKADALERQRVADAAAQAPVPAPEANPATAQQNDADVAASGTSDEEPPAQAATIDNSKLSLKEEAALLGESAIAADESAAPAPVEAAASGDNDSGEPAAAEPSGEITPAPQPAALNLPMGTWIGFHDGEAPLMAKLAVHDPELDLYIFVNRQGIKMRQLRRAELEDLVDRELVDILTTNTNFRAEVGRAREANNKNRDGNP